jgi:hypothetical protein
VNEWVVVMDKMQLTHYSWSGNVRGVRHYTTYRRAELVNHPLMTVELIKTINEERLLQAQRRRDISRRLVSRSRPQRETMRMALGPGVQFAGVTEQVLDTVANRPGRAPA